MPLVLAKNQLLILHLEKKRNIKKEQVRAKSTHEKESEGERENAKNVYQTLFNT